MRVNESEWEEQEEVEGTRVEYIRVRREKEQRNRG